MRQHTPFNGQNIWQRRTANFQMMYFSTWPRTRKSLLYFAGIVAGIVLVIVFIVHVLLTAWLTVVWDVFLFALGWTACAFMRGRRLRSPFERRQL